MKVGAFILVGAILLLGVTMWMLGPAPIVSNFVGELRGGTDSSATTLSDLDDVVVLEENPLYTGYESPFSDQEYHLGPYTLDNLGERYFSNIGKARSGDSDAMLQVSRVLFNCQHALSFRDRDSAWESFENGEITLAQHEETIRQMDVCDPIVLDVLSEFPDSKRHEIPFQVRQTWLRRSADAGNRYARLELVQDLPGQAEELAEILDELVDTKDPNVLLKAGEFVSVRSTEIFPHNYEKWEYLACLNLSSCNASIFKDQIQRRYSPTEQFEIMSFAENFKSLSDSGISFKRIYREQPYTAYTQQQIEQFEKYLEANDKVGEVGISVLFK